MEKISSFCNLSCKIETIWEVSGRMSPEYSTWHKLHSNIYMPILFSIVFAEFKSPIENPPPSTRDDSNRDWTIDLESCKSSLQARNNCPAFVEERITGSWTCHSGTQDGKHGRSEAVVRRRESARWGSNDARRRSTKAKRIPPSNIHHSHRGRSRGNSWPRWAQTAQRTHILARHSPHHKQTNRLWHI